MENPLLELIDECQEMANEQREEICILKNKETGEFGVLEAQYFAGVVMEKFKIYCKIVPEN